MKPTRTLPVGLLFGWVLLGVLVVPFVALTVSTSPESVRSGITNEMFAPALRLSLWTSFVSVVLAAIGGTPLAWWLATTRSRAAHTVSLLVQLPIVMPPAVVGIALLETFGRQGVLGPALSLFGVSIPFTATAVVLAQVVVAAPFYVQAASNAFREIDPETLRVARTLGATSRIAWSRVALPIALPGLAVGASLAWARALGEFGATLLFAGNLTGRTQTMPLAILSALEADIGLAVVFSLALALSALLVLGALQLVPVAVSRRRSQRS
ncbi:MAG: molybdate ABC transporter permease subunit [Gemmatimonadota bacterium]